MRTHDDPADISPSFMKSLALLLPLPCKPGLCAFSLALVAFPAHANNPAYEVWADVVDSRPVYRNVEEMVPQRICRMEQVREESVVPGRSGAGSTLVGGIIGGTLGHAAGRGDSNQKIGTAVGALLGAAVGSQIGGQTPDRTTITYRDVERCEIRERLQVREELVGYNVTYRYDGHIYTARTRKDPGDRLRLAVNVTPQEP